MDEAESLSHSRWECKYHVVFIPKCRRKTLYEQLRPHLGEVFRKLAAQKESAVLEGHLMADHVHMLIAIPPKYADNAGNGINGILPRSFCSVPAWISTRSAHGSGMPRSAPPRSMPSSTWR